MEIIREEIGQEKGQLLWWMAIFQCFANANVLRTFLEREYLKWSTGRYSLLASSKGVVSSLEKILPVSPPKKSDLICLINLMYAKPDPLDDTLSPPLWKLLEFSTAKRIKHRDVKILVNIRLNPSGGTPENYIPVPLIGLSRVYLDTIANLFLRF